MGKLIASSRVPGFIEPCLPSLVAEPPEGANWIHEIKHDGYRTLVRVAGGEGQAFTRNGHDWSGQYRRIVAAALRLGCSSALIDGEVIVQDENGVSDFHAMRSAVTGEPHRLIFFAFDLLFLDGDDLRPRPLLERRAMLKQLIGRAGARSPIQFSDHLEGSGAALFSAVEKVGGEGIVSKLASSRYRSGRVRTWRKTKCIEESKLVLIGTEKSRDGYPVALLARWNGAHLDYVGAAGFALRGDQGAILRERTAALRTDRPAIAELTGRQRVRWVRRVKPLPCAT